MTRALYYTPDGELCLPIEGLSIGRCCVDHAFILEILEPEGALMLRIEGSFTLKGPTGDLELNPASPGDLGPAMALFGASVLKSRVNAEGKLLLAFGDGRKLVVPSSRAFEAWEFAGPGGIRAVCMPGGDVATWGAGTKFDVSPQGTDS